MNVCYVNEKGNYYVSVYLNTNWICPSDLYIYDRNEKNLKLNTDNTIYTICNIYTERD